MFFVQWSFVSIAADADCDDLGIEAGLVGHEGVVGLPVLLDAQAVFFNRAMVQMPRAAHHPSARA
ncbi:MAG: hypothetical protein ACRYHQ_18280 [Janthinobacterium lividum]